MQATQSETHLSGFLFKQSRMKKSSFHEGATVASSFDHELSLLKAALSEINRLVSKPQMQTVPGYAVSIYSIIGKVIVAVSRCTELFWDFLSLDVNLLLQG